MNVRELIDELEKVNDKTLEVCCFDGNVEMTIDRVTVGRDYGIHGLKAPERFYFTIKREGTPWWRA